MRPEISNELLLQVIQAWDPTIADDLHVNDCGELRYGEDKWYVRWSNGDMYVPHRSIAKVSELVEFLLKDRPDLGDPEDRKWPYLECKNTCGGFWTSDPWESIATPDHMIRRIKSYEYLKGWKDTQEHLQLQDRLVECGKINPEDVRLTIDGQTIDRIPGEPVVGYSAPTEVPTTYEQLCPHCNGSKEVTGWLGKEVCNAC